MGDSTIPPRFVRYGALKDNANGSGDNYIRRYNVQSDDTVTNGRLLIDLSVDKTPGATVCLAKELIVNGKNLSVAGPTQLTQTKN